MARHAVVQLAFRLPPPGQNRRVGQRTELVRQRNGSEGKNKGYAHGKDEGLTTPAVWISLPDSQQLRFGNRTILRFKLFFSSLGHLGNFDYASPANLAASVLIVLLL